MSDRIKLELGEGPRSIQPGGSAQVSLTVHNTSSIVDQYAVHVDGLDPAWLSISPASLSLFPGDNATVTIAFSPPASEETAAGSHPFTITATSQDNPSESTQLEASLLIRPFGDFSFSISPETAVGQQAKYKLALANASNVDTLLTFAARDEEDALSYEFEWEKITVPAGGSVEVGLGVRPKKGRLTGANEEHRLRVTATREGQEEAEPALVEAVFTYQPTLGMLPRLPVAKWRWLLVLVPLLALAAYLAWPKASEVVGNLFGGDIALIPKPTPVSTPSVKPTPGPRPTSTPILPPEVVKVGAEVAGGTLQPFGLYWQVDRAATVEANYRADDAGSGPWAPVKSGAYYVKASNKGGEVSETLPVVVIGPPVIAEYFAWPQKVNPGEPVKLAWTVLGADEGDVEGEAVGLSQGGKEVQLDASGSFILRARNAVGEVSSIVYVDVVPFPTPTATSTPPATSTSTRTPTRMPTFTPTIPAPIVRLFATRPVTITAGTTPPVTLLWQTANATEVKITWTDAKGTHDIGPLGPNSNTVVYPVTTTRGQGSITFSLEAFNSAGTKAGPVYASLAVVQPVNMGTVFAKLICQGTTPYVDVTWSATGGPDAVVEVYRSGLSTPLFPGRTANLNGTFRDKPPYGTGVSYTVFVRNSAGAKDSGTTTPPVYPYCIG